MPSVRAKIGQDINSSSLIAEHMAEQKAKFGAEYLLMAISIILLLFTPLIGGHWWWPIIVAVVVVMLVVALYIGRKHVNATK